MPFMPKTTPRVITTARVQLGRTSGGASGDHNWRLEISDAPSGIVILRADTITAEQISDLLSGRSTEIQIELLQAPQHGRRCEVKPLLVPYPKEGALTTFPALVAKARKLVEPGWELDEEPSFNHHRVNREDNTYKFTQRRWVEI